MKTDPKYLGISIKFPIEDSWGYSFFERWSFRLNEFTHEKFDGGDYWSEFEGLTTKTKLIAAFRLKFLLLWAYFNYWGNWTNQLTKGLKVIVSTQCSAKRTRNKLGSPEEALSEHSPRDWLGGIASLSYCRLIINRFYLSLCYFFYHPQ